MAMNRKSSGYSGFGSNARSLLTRGIAAAKAGDGEEARFYLEWVLMTDASQDQQMEAWLWLSEVSDDPAEKRGYLEEILSRNPAHARARRRLALLDGRLRADEIVDPDNLPQEEERGPRPVGAQRYECPRCAARMVFAPDGATLQCEHCGYQEGVQGEPTLAEDDFLISMATAKGHSKPQAARIFACQSCTASYVLAPQALSLTCAYCDATYSVPTPETQKLVPPKGIVPFDVEAGQVQRLVRRWLQERHLRPHRPMRGIYLPAWTFDVGGTLQWRGYSSEYEGMTREWAAVSGEEPLMLDDLIVPACDTLPESLQRVVQRFDLGPMVAFDPSYLADWPAQTYEITVGDASLQARQEAYRLARRSVRRRHDDVHEIRFSSAGLVVLAYRLILLPLWLGSFSSKGQRFTIAVDGHTGKLFAQHPGPGGPFWEVREWISRLMGGR